MAGEMPAGLSSRDHAMIEYSIKVTRNPGSITPADIAVLRVNAFSDRAILEINLAAAYMNFVNRVALGLGVEPEGNMDAFSR